MVSPRETTAPRGPRTFKFGIQVGFDPFCHLVLEILKSEVICLRARSFKFIVKVDFDLFYNPVFEFLKLEVICLRYDLREKLRLSEDLGASNSVYRSIFATCIIQFWNL